MKNRNDLLDVRSAKGIDVFQMTTRTDFPSTHVYMEAQVFTPDSKRMVLHESCHAHGSDKDDAKHRYLLADLENPGAGLAPLTDELGPTAPSVSPDGKWLYYLVDRTEFNGGTLELKRVKLDGSARESIIKWDRPIEGVDKRISKLYPLSTISSDGQRFAFAGHFGDGTKANADFGLVVVDLKTLASRVIIKGPERFNLHPQYSRSLDPVKSHWLLIQENHGGTTRADASCDKGVGGLGADIQVINDDGTGFVDTAFGRSEYEQCQGHQCWRGRGDTILSTVGRFDHRMPMGADLQPGPFQEWVIEGTIGTSDKDLGLLTPGGRRKLLHEGFPGGPPRFFHFATDISGNRMVIDYNPDPERGMDLYVADLGEPLAGPVKKWHRILDTRTRFWKDKGHPHPFLSPDGKTMFFNSSESGIMQAYMVTGVGNL